MKPACRLAALAISTFVLLAGCRRPEATPATLPAPSGTPRVISLAPSMTEIVCAVAGANVLVGRTTACDYPPEVSSIPVIGGFGAPSLERLVAAAPTLVLDVDLADRSLATRLQELHIRREHIPCRTLDDIPSAMEKVGELLNTAPRAAALAAGLRAELARLREAATLATNAPSVFVEIWHDPVMTAGRLSFISELVRLAGGRNIGDAVEQEYFNVSTEWILEKNPDIILCLYRSDQGDARRLVLSRNGWNDTAAVRSKRVFDSFDNNLILRPGPRVLLSIEALHRAISGSPAP